jgi:hypothetical protein
MHLIQFTNKHNQPVFINPTQVVAVESIATDICISLSNGNYVIIDYAGTHTDKAIWIVTETLRLGRHPYKTEDTEEASGMFNINMLRAER